MTAITAFDLSALAEATAPFHHPHYRGATKDQFNQVTFDFAAFAGTEPEPECPATVWSDSVPRAARDLLVAEFERARGLWRDARYVRDLAAAADGAPSLWDAYAHARAEMDARYAAMDTTPDTHWRSAVSQLVTAQGTALEAALAWDGKAATIATVHNASVYSGDIPQAEAYRRIGVDASRWHIDSYHAYRPAWGHHQGTPLTHKVQKRIEEQREHLRTVTELSGDRGTAQA